ncbi:MAG: ribbon-helix-helix protein, CopG family [Deltaproteobacteria bacterium]|nr:MAG: ribbon-helix-helix protein, CopG family [Deltaproteobacteria bacterium]
MHTSRRGSEVRRTQIYLDEEIYERLKAESRIRKVSMSEIIRENLRHMRISDVTRMKRALKETAGIWRDREVDVEEYVRDVRKDRKR